MINDNSDITIEGSSVSGVKEMIKFSNSLKSNIEYGGSEVKEGILYQNEPYMVKFPKSLDNGCLSNNCFSEYVGSHVFASFGMDVHVTLLGSYGDSIVVACKDFIANTEFELIDFASTGESSYDIEKEQFLGYSYQNIEQLLSSHSKYCGTIDPKEFFWKLYVIDALLGNFDRHGMNWGFMKSENQYILAPVYDNGSCLFPRLQDEDFERILTNDEEMEKRTYQFPTSQIKLNSQKSSYFDIIASKQFPECTKAAKWLIDNYNRNHITKIIEETPTITDVRKEFYIKMIEYRFQHIFMEVFADE